MDVAARKKTTVLPAGDQVRTDGSEEGALFIRLMIAV
jgi:hypothetical protein